jgi:hypothetical protein
MTILTNREISDFLQIERDFWNGKTKKVKFQQTDKYSRFLNH